MMKGLFTFIKNNRIIYKISIVSILVLMLISVVQVNPKNDKKNNVGAETVIDYTIRFVADTKKFYKVKGDSAVEMTTGELTELGISVDSWNAIPYEGVEYRGFKLNNTNIKTSVSTLFELKGNVYIDVISDNTLESSYNANAEGYYGINTKGKLLIRGTGVLNVNCANMDKVGDKDCIAIYVSEKFDISCNTKETIINAKASGRNGVGIKSDGYFGVLKATINAYGGNSGKTAGIYAKGNIDLYKNNVYVEASSNDGVTYGVVSEGSGTTVDVATDKFDAKVYGKNGGAVVQSGKIIIRPCTDFGGKDNMLNMNISGNNISGVRSIGNESNLDNNILIKENTSLSIDGDINGQECAALYADNSNINIESGQVNIDIKNTTDTNKIVGILTTNNRLISNGNITVTDGRIVSKVTCDKGVGIEVASNMSVQGGKIIAQGKSYAVKFATINMKNGTENEPSVRVIAASTDFDGKTLIDYDENNVLTYKYIEIGRIYDYYLKFYANATDNSHAMKKIIEDGTEIDLTSSELSGWSVSEQKDATTGNYDLVLNGLNFITAQRVGLQIVGDANIILTDDSENSIRTKYNDQDGKIHGSVAILSSNKLIIKGNGTVVVQSEALYGEGTEQSASVSYGINANIINIIEKATVNVKVSSEQGELYGVKSNNTSNAFEINNSDMKIDIEMENNINGCYGIYAQMFNAGISNVEIRMKVNNSNNTVEKQCAIYGIGKDETVDVPVPGTSLTMPGIYHWPAISVIGTNMSIDMDSDKGVVFYSAQNHIQFIKGSSCKCNMSNQDNTCTGFVTKGKYSVQVIDSLLEMYAGKIKEDNKFELGDNIIISEAKVAGINDTTPTIDEINTYDYIRIEPTYYLTYNATDKQMYINDTDKPAPVSNWSAKGDGTLVLDGFNFTTSSNYGLKLVGDTTIELAEGSKNSITINNTGSNESIALSGDGTLTLLGSGKLVLNNNLVKSNASIESFSNGIVANSNITINTIDLGITINGDTCKGIYSINGDLVMENNTNITINATTTVGDSYLIYANNKMDINDSTLNVKLISSSINKDGGGYITTNQRIIYTKIGNINVNNSYIDINANITQGYGICAEKGTINVKDNSNINIKESDINIDTNANNHSAAIYSEKDIHITDCNMNIVSAKGYGLQCEGKLYITGGKVIVQGSHKAISIQNTSDLVLTQNGTYYTDVLRASKAYDTSTRVLYDKNILGEYRYMEIGQIYSYTIKYNKNTNKFFKVYSETESEEITETELNAIGLSATSASGTPTVTLDNFSFITSASKGIEFDANVNIALLGVSDIKVINNNGIGISSTGYVGMKGGTIYITATKVMDQVPTFTDIAISEAKQGDTLVSSVDVNDVANYSYVRIEPSYYLRYENGKMYKNNSTTEEVKIDGWRTENGELVLDGFNFTTSNKIGLECPNDVVINLVEGSSNSIEINFLNNSGYESDISMLISAKKNLTIKGKGRLDINANRDVNVSEIKGLFYGIFATKEFLVQNSILNICLNGTYSYGISKGNDMSINGGNLNICCNGYKRASGIYGGTGSIQINSCVLKVVASCIEEIVYGINVRYNRLDISGSQVDISIEHKGQSDECLGIFAYEGMNIVDSNIVVDLKTADVIKDEYSLYTKYQAIMKSFDNITLKNTSLNYTSDTKVCYGLQADDGTVNITNDSSITSNMISSGEVLTNTSSTVVSANIVEIENSKFDFTANTAGCTGIYSNMGNLKLTNSDVVANMTAGTNDYDCISVIESSEGEVIIIGGKVEATVTGVKVDAVSADNNNLNITDCNIKIIANEPIGITSKDIYFVNGVKAGKIITLTGGIVDVQSNVNYDVAGIYTDGKAYDSANSIMTYNNGAINIDSTNVIFSGKGNGIYNTGDTSIANAKIDIVSTNGNGIYVTDGKRITIKDTIGNIKGNSSAISGITNANNFILDNDGDYASRIIEASTDYADTYTTEQLIQYPSKTALNTYKYIKIGEVPTYYYRYSGGTLYKVLKDVSEPTPLDSITWPSGLSVDENNQLVLNGFEFATTANKVLDIVGEVKVSINGENTLVNVDHYENEYYYSIYSDSNITLSGNNTSKLNIISKDYDYLSKSLEVNNIYYAIYSLNNIDISGGSINFDAMNVSFLGIYGISVGIHEGTNINIISMVRKYGYGIYGANAGNIEINKANININIKGDKNLESAVYGVYKGRNDSDNKIKISGGILSVDIEAYDTYGIAAFEHNIILTNSVDVDIYAKIPDGCQKIGRLGPRACGITQGGSLLTIDKKANIWVDVDNKKTFSGDGIYVSDDMSIDDAILSVSNNGIEKSNAINCGKNISITGGSTVTAINSNEDITDAGCGIYAVENILVSNSTVDAKGQTSAIGVKNGGKVNIKGKVDASADYNGTLVTVTDINDSYSNYKYISIIPSVISVDITWGNMDFTYTEGSWNPISHDYNVGTWKPTDDKKDSAKITVNNANSNVPIYAEIGYASVSSDYNGIVGKIVDGEDSEIGDNVKILRGDSLAAYLDLDNKLPSTTSSKTPIGTVTVTISE